MCGECCCGVFKAKPVCVWQSSASSAAMSLTNKNSHVKVVNDLTQDSHEGIFVSSEHPADVQHAMSSFLDWALAPPLL